METRGTWVSSVDKGDMGILWRQGGHGYLVQTRGTRVSSVDKGDMGI